MCNEEWSDSEARVVCKQLRLPTIGAAALSGPTVPLATEFFMVRFTCTGTESMLSACVISGTTCGRYEEAGVRCQLGIL